MHDKTQESAFPHGVIGGHYGDNGMTLRDWFAGQALSGIVITDKSNSPDYIAHCAYAMANAMLAAREK